MTSSTYDEGSLIYFSRFDLEFELFVLNIHKDLKNQSVYGEIGRLRAYINFNTVLEVPANRRRKWLKSATTAMLLDK